MLAYKAIKNAIYDYVMKHGKKYAALEGYDPNADEDDEEALQSFRRIKYYWG